MELAEWPLLVAEPDEADVFFSELNAMLKGDS
jgi:hypothetical protein